MSTVWNIVWKDLVRFRVRLAAWTLLIVAKYLFFGYVAGGWGEADFALLGALQSAPGLLLSFVLEPVAAYFLVAGLVYEDPPAGKDPFWLTRPVSGGQLLLAKLLVAGLMFVLWPVLLGLPWWIECGYASTDLALVLGGMAGVYSAVVLTGLACASATNGYPRFILWTVAGFAAVTIVLMLPSLLLGVQASSSQASSLVHLGVLALALTLLAAEILRHQFVIRYFRWKAVVAAGGTLVAAALAFTAPLTGITSWFRAAGGEAPADESIRLSIAGPMRLASLDRTPDAVLVMPVAIDGLPRNANANLSVSGTWKSANGKEWSRAGSNSEAAAGRAIRQILNLPVTDAVPLVEDVRFVFNGRYAPGMTFAQLIASQANSFQGTATLHAADGELRAELPIREQTRRIEGGSLSITRLVRRGDQLTFTLTVRSPVSLNSWRGLGYIALLNRRTGEVIEPPASTRMGLGAAQIDLVAVVKAPVSFKIPSAPGWLEDATFVMIGFERGRNLARTIEPGPLTVAAAKTPVTVSREILRQYAGSYALNEGATVSITLEDDHLVARGTTIPETILFPESETRFFTRAPEAVLDFIKDDAGRVARVVVRQNGRERTVPRTGGPSAP